MIVTAEAEPSYYMSGNHCWNAAQTFAARSGWPLVSAHLVHDVLTDPEIHPDLTNTTSFQGVAVVQPIPVLDTDDPGPLYGPDYAVYRIIDHQERPLGWFFNREDLEATVRNPSPSFQCINGHSNADTDSGYCSFCPGKLI